VVLEITRRRFADQGVDPGQLSLQGQTPDRADHFAAYNKVDVALDPFPYNGATTSVESLWMGVPFIARRGDRFIAHVGESIAVNAGLRDWIAENDDDYIAKAVAIANDLPALAALRARLRAQMLASPLCDAPRFARHFESALWAMWRRWSGSAG
jgi:protein O-GlcNAc transferase